MKAKLSKTSQVGSSNCFKVQGVCFHKVKYVKHLNGELVIQQTRMNPTKKKSNVKKGRKKGSKVSQSVVTPKGKRTFRQAGYLYRKMNRKKKGNNNSSFGTLSYRKILPKSDKVAKEMLKAFFERLRAEQKELHYGWKAELQDGIKKKSYRYYHEVAIHFHFITPHFIPKKWLNYAWNMVVANRFLKECQITEWEYQIWMNEIDIFQRTGRCKNSQFLLTPNIRGVRNPDRYMSKYLSKACGKIEGNVWNISEATRKEIQPKIFEDEFDSYNEASEFVRNLYCTVNLKLKGMRFWYAPYSFLIGFFTYQGNQVLNQLDWFRYKHRKNYFPELIKSVKSNRSTN